LKKMFARWFVFLALILTAPVWLPIVLNSKWSEWQRKQHMKNGYGELKYYPEDFGGWQS